jgi:hypothetical protein
VPPYFGFFLQRFWIVAARAKRVILHRSLRGDPQACRARAEGKGEMMDPDAVKRAIRGGPVDENTELAAAIGRCSNNWAHAESRLTIIFCLLSKTDLTTAVTIFSFFKATRTQIDVLKRLGKISLDLTPQKFELLADLMKEYQSLAEERNRLLHNPIGMNEELYIMLRDKSPDPGSIPYKTETISIEAIDDLSSRISVFNLKAIILSQAISGIPFPTEAS